MREQMPETAAFVDEMRAIFGREHVDGQIRLGMRGQPVFWARENGIEIGTPPQVWAE
jgi:hypothetical protein